MTASRSVHLGVRMIKFNGKVYVKPCGRGIKIIYPEKLYGRGLDEIFEENKYYKISMEVQEVSEEDALGADDDNGFRKTRGRKTLDLERISMIWSINP